MSKQARTAITPTRAENFPEWYQQVIKAADMAENAPVRGCMIIKPYGYALWEEMQRVFDRRIKEQGVQNAYFPLLIPMEFMNREAAHVDGFAKECAVVTHHRLETGPDGNLIPAPTSRLEEPYIIRPTSEMIIGDAMARWVQSYRDLPLKLNQWCNVMRWEMRTRMFLRTSEFLWQEGHNAFASAEEARADSLKMLDEYVKFCEDTLALASVAGTKTEDEKFPGAVETYTFEMMMQDGKALQSGTSHYLGQNFAKSIGIKFQDKDGQEQYAHTTSWGISTRLIGALIMSHADDDGMIMPPRVAPQQVVILPVLKDDAESAAIMTYCEELAKALKAKGLRVRLDDRDMRTTDKMWDAVKKGIPVRVEVGQREKEEGQITFIRRDIGRDSKKTIERSAFIGEIDGVLDDIHEAMLARSKAFCQENIFTFGTAGEVEEFFAAGKIGFVKVPAALLGEEKLATVMGAHSLSARCLPFSDEGQSVLIGKSY
ncbi:MAG: proline--tRNA ligase [Alphaproteobacteria bacterium]|nr:proline--tRNA ligase [Alphaproteobacteria bacterium]